MTNLATLIADRNGIVDIYRRGTYGGGIIPRARQRPGLAFCEVLNDPSAADTRATYERAVILVTGGFAD